MWGVDGLEEELEELENDAAADNEDEEACNELASFKGTVSIPRRRSFAQCEREGKRVRPRRRGKPAHKAYLAQRDRTATSALPASSAAVASHAFPPPSLRTSRWPCAAVVFVPVIITVSSCCV
jgi:hypothetical protein